MGTGRSRPRIMALPLLALLGSAAIAGCGTTQQSAIAPGMMEQAPQNAAIADPAAPPPGSGAGPANAAPRPTPMLIRTARLTLRVEDVAAAIGSVQAIARAKDGDLLDLQDLADPDNQRQAHLVLRVPQGQLDGTLDAIAALGRPIERQVAAEDVTDRIVDADARLRNLRRKEQSFLAILDRAGAIKDVLAVTEQVERTRTEIEVLDAQLKFLRDRVAYSQITVQLRQSLASGSNANPLSAQLLETWGQASNSLGSVTVGILKLLLWLLVYTPYWLAIAAIIWAITRRIRRPS
ncbi:MAG: hypothetical protein Fur0042_12200 [Cyanophyceae cyanobacterium]